MRKAEFKTQAKKINYYNQDGYCFYRTQQYRWDNTADPEREDFSYHLNMEEAKKAAKAINLNIGFHAQVEELFIPYKTLNEEIDFAEDFELSDLDNYSKFYTDCIDTVNFDINKGDNIEGGIIIEWTYEKYVGYARNFISIFFADDKFSFESDLITGNEESTFKNNYSLLLTKSEIKDLSQPEILDLIMEKIYKNNWKWNQFRHFPSKEKIIFNLGF